MHECLYVKSFYDANRLSFIGNRFLLSSVIRMELRMVVTSTRTRY